jgi:hypothetical protein
MSTIQEVHVRKTKQWRKDLDSILQSIKDNSDRNRGMSPDGDTIRSSKERSLAITKLQEAIMWLGMDLKDMHEPNPYPESLNPDSPIIEPTADGLKL